MKCWTNFSTAEQSMTRHQRTYNYQVYHMLHVLHLLLIFKFFTYRQSLDVINNIDRRHPFSVICTTVSVLLTYAKKWMSLSLSVKYVLRNIFLSLCFLFHRLGIRLFTFSFFWFRVTIVHEHVFNKIGRR